MFQYRSNSVWDFQECSRSCCKPCEKQGFFLNLVYGLYAPPFFLVLLSMAGVSFLSKIGVQW